jgi:hypothetical protein
VAQPACHHCLPTCLPAPPAVHATRRSSAGGMFEQAVVTHATLKVHAANLWMRHAHGTTMSSLQTDNKLAPSW